jgi:hypothetical protein
LPNAQSPKHRYFLISHQNWEQKKRPPGFKFLKPQTAALRLKDGGASEKGSGIQVNEVNVFGRKRRGWFSKCGLGDRECFIALIKF